MKSKSLTVLGFSTLLIAPAWADHNGELLQTLVKEEKYGKILKVMEEPKEKTSTSLVYKFEELELKPNEILYFYVPDSYTLRPVSALSFGIRQDESPMTQDLNPGLISGMIYDEGFKDDELRYWGGHSSGKFGAKFAEQRPAPEIDSLYEWPLIGHKGTVKKERSFEGVNAGAIRIQNLGSDDVLVSQVVLDVIAPKAKQYLEKIFCVGSNFGDAETMKGRAYGGGQKFKGKFPGSLRLSSFGHKSVPELPPYITLKNNEIFIELEAKAKLKTVDIMVGDTHPDEIINKDKGWGTLGNAKLSVEVRNIKTGDSRFLLYQKNVGPEGVISAGEIEGAKSLSQDERIVISNKLKRDTAYIMALRIGID
ncbi:MAG: hypothetical protein ACOYL6_08580 [Bacteriovoracaceae bacterium]